MATTKLPLTVPDLVCMLDADPFGRETKSDLETLTQDVFHRLIEPPGSNIDDETLGIGVEEELSNRVPDFLKIQRRIDRSLPADDRIQACTSKIIRTGENAYRLDLNLTVDGKTTGLSFVYTNSGGLVPE